MSNTTYRDLPGLVADYLKAKNARDAADQQYLRVCRTMDRFSRHMPEERACFLAGYHLADMRMLKAFAKFREARHRLLYALAVARCSATDRIVVTAGVTCAEYRDCDFVNDNEFPQSARPGPQRKETRVARERVAP